MYLVSKIIKLLICLCSLLICMETLADMPSPNCVLYQDSQANSLRFELHNPSTQTWFLPSWKTPFDAWFSEFLTIRDVADNRHLPYQGALAKRGALTQTDVITLAAGSLQQLTLDLTEIYPLKSGNYLVTLAPLRLYQRLDSALAMDAPSLILTCDLAELNIP